MFAAENLRITNDGNSAGLQYFLNYISNKFELIKVLI